MAALDAAEAAFPGLGGAEAARARRDPAQGLRADHGAEGGARPPRSRWRTARRCRIRAPRSPTRRNSSAGAPRRRCGRSASSIAARRRGARILVAAQAGRHRGAGHAVEFSGRDGDAQDRPGARRRLPGDPEAGLGDAAHHAGADADPGAGGRAEGRHQRAAVAPLRRRWSTRCCTTRACASSPSPARPRSAASCCTRRPTTSSSRRWSSAATRPSSCWRTPTSTPRSAARSSPRCATSARPARRRTASTCTTSVHDAFAEKLADKMGAMKIGNGLEEGVEVGSLVNARDARQGGRAGRRRGEARRQGADRRQHPQRAGLLLSADGAGRRAGRRPLLPRGDFWAGRGDRSASPTRRR